MTKIAVRTARSLALATIALAASPAFAQDEVDFNGFRAGVLVGYDSVSPGDEAEDISLDGFAYYAEIGRDFQIGDLVLGFGSEYGSSTASDEVIDGPVSESIETGVDFFIGARVGYVVGGRTMIYAKGGYTNNEVKIEIDDPDFGLIEADPGVDGFRIGAGVEHMISSSFYIKGEARYSNYSNLELTFDDISEDVTDTITDGEGTPTFEDDELDLGIDLDRFQLLVGVGVKF